MKRKFNPPSFVNGGQGLAHKKREGAHTSGQSSSQQAAKGVQVAKNRPPLQDICSNVQSSCQEAAVSRSKDAGNAAIAKKEDLTLSGKTFHSVMYIKRELFMKKKVSKAWSDGVLSRAPAGEAVLHDLSTGKVVSSGRVKEVTELQLLGPTLSYKDRQKMGKGAGKGAAEDDEEDQECQRPLLLLNSMVMEVEEEMDAERFRSGACFTATPITAAAIAASKPGGSLKAAKGFKAPSMAGNGKASQLASRPVVAKPLHDISHPDTVLLNEAQWQQGAGRLPDDKPVVPVCIDPYLKRMLRPHQVEGVQFMYECVMGLKNKGYQGCVLADEMGLGKTLQVLTLIWTLLRQGPDGKPVAKKVLVVTPATLCANWEKETRRWLGVERLQVFMLMQQQQDALNVLQFKNGSVVKMCVTSYETIRKHSTSLAGTFDLMVCDEGHRLKSVGGNKTIDALLELNCPRRVLLTGTPVQNNLQEFFALLSFVAPELLGSSQTFKRVYSDPIAKSHDRAATKEEEEIGKARESELKRKVASFMLRRTQAVLARHLPPLCNIILFCKPTLVQEAAYKEALKGVLPQLNTTSGMGDSTLAAITVLRKCCNHPELLSDTSEDKDTAKPAAGPPKQAAAEEVSRSSDKRVWLPPGMHLGQGDKEASGKMRVLDGLLDAILAAGDRIVIVSTSTSALDCIHKLLLQPKGLSVKRIDGSVGVDERQSSVDSFNMGHGQVFLLSTRAGGAGLNLIGANHLVLYDSDWNPAADLQAQGRIWRDGQKKPCSIWRLLTCGTLEEKIFMRQIVKGDLATATMGAAGAATGTNSKQFSRDEIRQLFTLSSPDTCETKTLLEAHASGTKQASMQWLDVSAASRTQAGLPVHVHQALASALRTFMVSAASIHRPAQMADEGGSA